MKAKMTFALLGVSMVGSFLTAAATVLVLNPEDRISITRGAVLTALGFVFFLSLFDFLNHMALRTGAGQRLRKKYQLTCGDVLDISNKLVSAVQAVLCCLTGVVVCLWSCTRDFLRSSHFMSEAYAWFGAAYFFYDIWSMYKVHIYMTSDKSHANKEILHKGEKPGKNGDSAALSCGDGGGGVGAGVAVGELQPTNKSTTFLDYCKNEPVILMHHLFIGGFGFLVIVYLRGGLGDCTFGFVYLMELSTPFVSFRGILSRLKMKSSRLYVINGVTMLLTFFVCRIMSLPYVCYMFSEVVELPYFEALNSLPIGCKVSICILLLPQMYWFYLMSAGAVKVFFPPKPKAKALLATSTDNNSNHATS